MKMILTMLTMIMSIFPTSDLGIAWIFQCFDDEDYNYDYDDNNDDDDKDEVDIDNGGNHNE